MQQRRGHNAYIPITAKQKSLRPRISWRATEPPMKGNEIGILDFMEGAKLRFVIPVYQRRYEWKQPQCRQLFNDLKKVIADERNSHFFGSIVSRIQGDGNRVEYIIIDGQQRLTTVTLILLAIRDYVIKHRDTCEERLDDQVKQRFLISPWAKEDDRIKLRPVKSDREALRKLMDLEGEPERERELERASNLTLNYEYFMGELEKGSLPVAKLLEALGRLEVISITLDGDDDPQLIFESLNSTGLDLSEGDKIRNYLLMGADAILQEQYYNKYWEKIELCTNNDVSAFVRDYLSVKQQATPTIRNVYQDFKRYVEERSLPIQPLLEDLLRYAFIFKKLLTGESGLGDRILDACLTRYRLLDLNVVRPFFMEVFRLHQDGELSLDDVLRILRITETYLFRRNICEVPTNALNKIFVTVNREIQRFDGTTGDYVDKYVFALLARRDSGRFPDDDEFLAALSQKNVYMMRGPYKIYLLERFENFGTTETKDVYERLAHNEYTIEHIMPQHLSSEWVESLGPNYEEIHETWLHRLANLTLTGYNPNLGNRTFQEKRDAVEGGYRNSGLRMNQLLASKESWGEAELVERSREMLARALEIWPFPETDFMPAQKGYESATLDDEDFDGTGYEILKYSFDNSEQRVVNWLDMFERVVKALDASDRNILAGIACGTRGVATGVDSYFSTTAENLRSPLKLDENLFVEKNTSTSAKLSILRKLFALYDRNPMELVFFLKGREPGRTLNAQVLKADLIERYWDFALPRIQASLEESPVEMASNSDRTRRYMNAYCGIGGCTFTCIANKQKPARVELGFWHNDADANKKMFDFLGARKASIESQLGVSLNWNRLDDMTSSTIDIELDGVSLANENAWERMADFHAEWLGKFARVFYPLLREVKESK